MFRWDKSKDVEVENGFKMNWKKYESKIREGECDSEDQMNQWT